MQFVAMIGFGKKATTLLVDPEALLSFPEMKDFSPLFNKLIKAKMEDDFKELTRKNTWKKTEMPQHAILVPTSPEKFLSIATKLIRE